MAFDINWAVQLWPVLAYSPVFPSVDGSLSVTRTKGKTVSQTKFIYISRRLCPFLASIDKSFPNINVPYIKRSNSRIMAYFLHALFFKREGAPFDMTKMVAFQNATEKRYNMAFHLDETILQLTIPCLPSTEQKTRDQLFAAMDEYDLHNEWPKVLIVTNDDQSDVPKAYIDGTLTRELSRE